MARKNWRKKVEKRQLRREVAARLTDLCAFSGTGEVSWYPGLWSCYTPEGKVSHNGTFRPWLDFSGPELEAMLVQPLYPVEPKSPLVVLAEQAL